MVKSKLAELVESKVNIQTPDFPIFAWSEIGPRPRVTPVTVEWTLSRLAVYLRYTVASVRKQTVKGSKCIVESSGDSYKALQDRQDILDEAGIILIHKDYTEEFYPYIGDAPACIFFRVDSDDMLAPRLFELVRKYQRRYKHILAVNGYVATLKDGKLTKCGRWTHPSPPFYAFRRTREEVAGGYKVIGKHDRFRKISNHILPEGLFLVLRHEYNTRKDQWPRRFTRFQDCKDAIVRRFQLASAYWVPDQHPNVCEFLGETNGHGDFADNDSEPG